MQMPQGLAAQHSSELFFEDLGGEHFPLSQNRRTPALFGVRLSAPQLFPAEGLKLVSPHTQLLATPGKIGADRSPHAQSHRKTAIPATMQMRVGVRVTKRVSSTLQRAFSREEKRVTKPTRAQGSRMRQSRLSLGRPLVRTFHSKGGPPLSEISTTAHNRF